MPSATTPLRLVSTRLRLGTRSSPLALVQAAQVQSALAKAWPSLADEIEIITIKTTGDQIRDRSLADIGGKGLFVRELEQALLDDRIDLAVHSLKDVPSILTPDVRIAATLPRDDPRDALLIDRNRLSGIGGLADLPPGAVIGTCSPRRAAQLLAHRPDCRIVDMRGNVETRLRKLESGGIDATVLALAGLRRLGLAARADHVLAPEEMLPAAAQGVIGIEIRSDDSRMAELLAAIDDAPTHRAVRAERAMLAVLDGSCRTPIGAFAVARDARRWHLEGLLARPNGDGLVSAHGEDEDPERLGRTVGAALRTQAGTGYQLDATGGTGLFGGSGG